MTEDRKDTYEGIIEMEDSKIDVLALIGPLGQAKRGLMDSIHDFRESFSIPSTTVIQLISYSEENLIELNTDDFIQLIDDSVGTEEGQLQPGEGLIMLVIPHTMDHIKIINHLETSNTFRVRSVFTKIVL